MTETRVSESIGPIGIGGWMILPMIGMAATILFTGKNLTEIVPYVNDFIGLIDRSDIPVSYLVAAFGSLVGGVVVIATAATTLYRILTKNKKAPGAAQIHYIVLLLVMLFEAWADVTISGNLTEPADPEAINGVISGIIAISIWVPYFRMSKRVKNTFVN